MQPRRVLNDGVEEFFVIGCIGFGGFWSLTREGFDNVEFVGRDGEAGGFFFVRDNAREFS